MVAAYGLAFLGAIAAWIIAGVKASQQGGSDGVKFFFKHLVFCILAIGLLFLLIVLPSLDCTGILCGLIEILIFFAVGGLTFLIWPLILIPIIKAKFAYFNKDKSSDDSILDGDL